MAELSIKMFGTPSISVDGRPITFPYRKADALLYYMVLQKRVARNELASILWAESDITSALKNLRHAVYTTRKGLGFDIFSSGQSTMLELDPHLTLHCDVLDFLKHRDLNACQGEFLEGFEISSSLFEQWLSDQRNLLHNSYLKELLLEVKKAAQEDDPARAEQLGLRYLQLDPLEESAVVAMMNIYSAQKKYRKAVGIYHDLCRNLSEELGISPLKETTARYYHIVNEWNSSTYKMEEQAYHPLVGKSSALRGLLSLFNRTAGEPQIPLALIHGEAGVGKTYLLDYLLNYYDLSDWIVFRSYCYQSESSVSLTPWNAIMMSLMTEIESGELSVPENYLKTASVLFPCLSAGYEQDYSADLNYPLQQNYHVAQESAILLLLAAARKHPMLLVFEDVHWMDTSSAELLSTFLRRIRGSNIMVICTSRNIFPEHIRSLLDNARKDGIISACPVQRFSREETEHFVQHYLSCDYNAQTMEQIYQSTDGNALLLVQLINFLRENADLSDIPKGLENIIGDRLSHLSAEERQVLDLISVFTDWAPMDALSSILTKSVMSLLHICDQLKRRTLVMEAERDGDLCYALEHEQIRAALVKQQPVSARRMLNLRVARYLENNIDRCQRPYDRLICHYALGGDRFKELQYRVLSINHYMEMYYAVFPTLPEDTGDTELQNVPTYFQRLERMLADLRAIHFGTQEIEELDRLESTLLYSESCYDIYVGLYPSGLAALKRLESLCQKTGNDKLLILLHLQFIYYGIQIYDVSVIDEHLRVGMELLKGQEMTENYATYLRMEGLFQTMTGKYEDALSTFKRSVDIFRGLTPDGGDRYAINIAGSYNYIAEIYRLNGQYDQAFRAYDQAIIYNRSRGYYPGAAVFYTNYGVAAFQKGERAVARQLFHFALETYRAAHEYSGRPIALSYLAYYEAEDGNYAHAAEQIREAFQVSEQINSPWWMGITLYQCWKIRELLDAAGVEAPTLRALWPEDPLKHCRLCLSYLHRIQPRLETQEMERALAQLDRAGA